MPLAESVVKLTAVCMQCFKDASFTKRTCEGTEVSWNYSDRCTLSIGDSHVKGG